MRKATLRPMHAVGLMASSARTELTLTLKPSSIAGSTEDLQTGTCSGARRRAYGETQDPTVLYISAANTTPDGSTFKAYITLVESADASDGYVSGEDALSLVSDTYNETNLHTPLALYSVCDNRPLMYDRRETLENVPLAFASWSRMPSAHGRSCLSLPKGSSPNRSISTTSCGGTAS